MWGGHRGLGYLGQPRDQGRAKYKVRGQLEVEGAEGRDQSMEAATGVSGGNAGWCQAIPRRSPCICHPWTCAGRREVLEAGAGPGRDRADSGGAPSPRASVETVMQGPRVREGPGCTGSPGPRHYPRPAQREASTAQRLRHEPTCGPHLQSGPGPLNSFQVRGGAKSLPLQQTDSFTPGIKI